MAHNEVHDPCGSFGSVQRWAVVWAVGAIAVGALLTYNLSRVDNWMFQHNGEFLDYVAYRDNREAAIGIGVGADNLDPRAQGDFVRNLEQAGLPRP